MGVELWYQGILVDTPIFRFVIFKQAAASNILSDGYD
jgi:hypothetical protein